MVSDSLSQKIKLQDQEPGLITQELLYCRVLFEYKKGQRKLLTKTSERGWRVHPSLVLAREFYTFLIGYYNKSKNVSSLWKFYQTPSHNLHFKKTGLELTIERSYQTHRDWDRTVFECLLRRYQSAVGCCRGRGSGCSRPGYGINPPGGGCH